MIWQLLARSTRIPTGGKTKTRARFETLPCVCATPRFAPSDATSALLIIEQNCLGYFVIMISDPTNQSTLPQ